MAKLTKTEVAHVAKLAKLNLSSKETVLFQKQLSQVLDYVDKLNEVDTKDQESTSQTTGLENVFRSDKILTSNSLSHEESLSGTEKTHNGYFVVDAILVNKDL